MYNVGELGIGDIKRSARESHDRCYQGMSEALVKDGTPDVARRACDDDLHLLSVRWLLKLDPGSGRKAAADSEFARMSMSP